MNKEKAIMNSKSQCITLILTIFYDLLFGRHGK